MDCFKNGRTVRLCSHDGKYLVAKEDKVSVTQDRNGSDNCAIWTIELNTSNNNIWLKSCYDMYLTASTQSFNFGEIGKKVVQSLRWSSSSVDWSPIIDGDKVKFQTESGSCLRADEGIPPWRNVVTHKVPRRSPIYQGYLWHVDFLENEASVPTFQPRPDKPKRKRDKIKGAARAVVEAVGAAGVVFGTVTAI